MVMNQLRNKVIPLLNSNQYSFPGKGCPVAIVSVLDELNYQVSQGIAVLLVLWDFSNAFCTFFHDVAIDIARKFNFSDRLMELFIQFLEQTSSTIKISDSGGYYLSDQIKTGRGGQQGQIGTDFVFAMLNDGIQPKSFFGEFIRRMKYVDDFQDIMACSRTDLLFKSVIRNSERIYSQSTSLGFKINEIKLKMLAFHIPESEVNPAFKYVPGTSLLVKQEADLSDEDLAILPPLLGLGFDKNSDNRSKLKVCADKGANNCLSRLKSCYPIVLTSRKVERNSLKRINTATAMVWSSCYDIGPIYCYVSKNKFAEIEVSIRKLIRLAGLDQLTPRDVVYKLSTTLSPEDMATKQIIQLGLKMVNKEELGKNRNLIKAKIGDDLKPFWNNFSHMFNALPQASRDYIFKNLDPLDKAKMNGIKEHLKTHFQKKLLPTGVIKETQKWALLKKFRYSKAKVELSLIHI